MAEKGVEEKFLDQQLKDALVSPGGLWSFLGAAMQAETSVWPQLAPANAALALVPLSLVRALAEHEILRHTLFNQHILNEHERQELRHFSLAKRRNEWLGGRLAAKYALHVLAPGFSLLAFDITNDACGKPVVSAAGEARKAFLQPPSLSISHSAGLAAALAGPISCGLDVQEITPRLLRLSERFASESEIALGRFFPEISEVDWLALLWTAKEAIKKCRYPDRLCFMEGITVAAHNAYAGGAPERGLALLCQCAGEKMHFPVRAAVRNGYALALALGANDA